MRSLATKIIALLLLALCLFFSLMAWNLIRNERQILGELLEHHGKSTAHAISVFCIESLLSEDYPVLNTFLETIGREKSVVSIQILQGDRVVSEYRNPTASTKNQEIFRSDIKFSSGGISQRLGEVRLGLSNVRNEEIISSRVRQVLVGIVTIFVLVFVTLTVALKKVVINRITRLASEAQRIRQGQFDIRMPISSSDELGSLAAAFNDMLTTIEDYQRGLEHKVEERTRELRQAQQDLINKALEAGRAQLSAMVLHNIGNAMTPMKIQVENMIGNDSMQTAKYIQQCYQDLNSHAENLGQYINEDERGKKVFAYLGELADSLEQLMQDEEIKVSKLTKSLDYVCEIIALQQTYAANEQEIKEKVNVNVLLEDALRMQDESIRKCNVTIQKDFNPDSHLEIYIDKNRLMQVIGNFIKNSLEAMDEVADDRKKILTVGSFDSASRIFFTIKDNGIGIAPRDIKLITEFGRSNKGSSGFGLYYCKMFFESNDGKLEINSHGPGNGATVTASFPKIIK